MKTSYRMIHTSFSKIFIFTSICLLFGLSSHAQVSVEMKLDTADILVGQQVQLSTIVSANTSQHVLIPSFNKGEELVKGLEVIQESGVDTTFINNQKRVQLQKKFTITAFDSALYNIPPMAVIVDGDTVRATAPVGLKVNVVPVDTTKVDIFAGPHAVVPETFIWRSKLTGLSLILWGVLLLVFAISIKLTKRKPLTTKKVIKPQIAPCKQALASLKELEHIEIRDQNDVKAFHIALTDALRVYLQRRFNVLALEKTTEEILSSMKDYVNEQDFNNLKYIFETADLAKFAKFMTSEFEMQRCLNSAKQFLNNTIDEVLENPQPEIQIIVLNDGMQKKYRILLWSSLVVLVLGGLCFADYLNSLVFETFF